MMRIFKTFSCFYVFLFITGALYAQVPSEKGSNGILTGKNWIQNEKIKVTMEGRSVLVYVRDMNTNAWNRLAIGRLQGLLKPDKLMKPYRKLGGYYLFSNNKETVENLKTAEREGSAVISFRTSRENLWIDTEVIILKNSNLVLIKTAGKSSDTVVPLWGMSFHRTWEKAKWWMPLMTHLAFDKSGQPDTAIMAAIDYREKTKNLAFKKYCISYRPGTDRLWGFLYPPKAGKEFMRIQFPTGAIRDAWLNAPFVLFGERMSEEKDAETMGKLGKKLYNKMCTLVENKK